MTAPVAPPPPSFLTAMKQGLPPNGVASQAAGGPVAAPPQAVPPGPPVGGPVATMPPQPAPGPAAATPGPAPGPAPVAPVVPVAMPTGIQQLAATQIPGMDMDKAMAYAEQQNPGAVMPPQAPADAPEPAKKAAPKKATPSTARAERLKILCACAAGGLDAAGAAGYVQTWDALTDSPAS